MFELFLGLFFGAVIAFGLTLSAVRPDLMDDDDDCMG